MNTFVVVAVTFVALTVCTAEERGPRNSAYAATIEKCQTLSKASDGEVKAFMSRQLQTTKEGWCMVSCFKKELGVVNANNQIDMDKVKETMVGAKANNKEMYEKIIGVITECKKQVESDPKNTADGCVFAEAMGKCVVTKKAAAGIP